MTKKRQKIQLGDIIIFTNRENTDQTVTVEVIVKFGDENVEWLENQISEFYSIDQQKENNVIGIKFVLL